jgi:hypothetical protein
MTKIMRRLLTFLYQKAEAEHKSHVAQAQEDGEVTTRERDALHAESENLSRMSEKLKES